MNNKIIYTTATWSTDAVKIYLVWAGSSKYTGCTERIAVYSISIYSVGTCFSYIYFHLDKISCTNKYFGCFKNTCYCFWKAIATYNTLENSRRKKSRSFIAVFFLTTEN